jgi:hypothetical protein
MSRQTGTVQETFVARAIRLLGQSVRSQFLRVNRWRDRATEATKDALEATNEWILDAKWPLIIGLGIVIWAILLLWFFIDAARGNVEGNVVQVGVGGAIGGAIAGLVLSPLIGLIAFLLLLLLLAVVSRVVITVTLFIPLFLWISVYATWHVFVACGQLLLLIPLFLLVAGSRSIQLWRGIFYTCPSRRCSYRGLPAYVCSHCREINDKLWPNLYGLFWHHCTKCDQKLPTLDLLGRKQLKRCCGRKDCHMPLLGRHAGRSPERLVAIVGGSDSGKTCYLHMAVNQIVHGNGQVLPIRGMIDDPQQERVFKEAWSRLNSGVVAARKTKEVTHAYILHARVHGRRCQLYLYDAPGEEFSSISSMSRQQYFSLIEGFILLVDPMSFVAVAGPGAGTRTQLGTVVSSTLGTAVAGMMPGPDGRFPQRVAVVISKGDAAVVRDRIGDVRRGAVSGEVCRQAICDWGGEHPVRLIEQRFAQVRCFACSSLGREAGTQSAKPFRGSGLLEPLCWILNACEDRPAQVSLPRSSEKR